MLDIASRTLHFLTLFTPSTTLWDRYCSYPHFTEEGNEAQRGELICPESQSFNSDEGACPQPPEETGVWLGKWINIQRIEVGFVGLGSKDWNIVSKEGNAEGVIANPKSTSSLQAPDKVQYCPKSTPH